MSSWKRTFAKTLLGLCLLGVGVKFYAWSQWPRASKFVISDSEQLDTDDSAYRMLNDIIQQTPEMSSYERKTQIQKENYRDEFTDHWRIARKSILQLESLMEFDSLSVPQNRDGQPNFDTFKLFSLLYFNEVKVWDHIKNKEVEEALHQISVALHVTYLIRNARVRSFDMTLVNDLQARALVPLQEILDTEAWGSIQSYETALSMLKNIDDDKTFLKGLEVDAKIVDERLQNEDGRSLTLDQREIPLWEYLYDEDASRGAAAEFFSKLAINSQRPYLEREDHIDVVPDRKSVASIVHNSYGREVLETLLFPSTSHFFVEEEILLAQRRILMVTCAARLHMWKNNALKPQSSHILQSYFDQIPKDPFGLGEIGIENGKVYSMARAYDELRDIGGPFQNPIVPEERENL